MMALRGCSLRAQLAALVVVARFAGAQAVDRSQRPPTPPLPSVVFPSVHTESLPNGLRVQVVENHSLPLVAVRVAIARGSLLDPPGKEGLFTLDTLVLRDGTTSMSGDRLAELIDELGSPITPSRFTTITSAFEPSLAILADMLMHPAFPVEAVEQRRAVIAASLQRAEGTASTPALRIFNILLFGSTHPFARTITEASLSSITRDDLVAAHERVVRPETVTLTIVGDVTPRSAMSAVGKVFASWPRRQELAAYTVSAPPPPKPTTIYLYDRPGSAQSTVVIGQTGPTQTSPDFAALEALGALFGGPTGSRLTLALRENRPLTYAVSHRPVWRRANDPSSFFGSSNVDVSKTDSAVVVWLDELRALAGSRPPTDSELSFAQTATVRSLVTRIETIDEIANRLNIAALSEFPLDYYNDYIKRLDHVTTADLAAAARKYIDPSHSTIVIVGDRARIEPGLRAANIAPIVIVDGFGRAIP